MVFDLQPTLENESVILRPLKEDDFEDLYRVASDPLIWEQHPAKERSQREGFSLFFKEAMTSKGAFVMIDKKAGKIIGSTRFNRVKESSDAIEIGWTFLARDYWGGYYNQVIKTLQIEYAFNYVTRVLFYIHESNFRSQRAVEKLGGERITSIDGKALEIRPTASVTYQVRKKTPIQKKAR